MKQVDIKLNRTYRVKRSVLESSVGIDGKSIEPNVTLVRVKFPAGRKQAWFFDAKGNAFRSSDFEKPSEVIALSCVAWDYSGETL